METITCKEKLRNTTRFKSYYVVWKRYIARQEMMMKKKFKSYYVVWKL